MCTFSSLSLAAAFLCRLPSPSWRGVPREPHSLWTIYSCRSLLPVEKPLAESRLCLQN